MAGLLEVEHSSWIQFVLNLSVGSLFLIIFCPHECITLGVMAGVVADLSVCSPELARRLVDADDACVASGAGYIYGQLVVLGYKVNNGVNSDE